MNTVSRASNMLCDLVKAQDWLGVSLRLSGYPTEAMMQDERGRTALHHACSATDGPPVDICRDLLITFMGAAWTEDEFGWTPLSLACANRSSVEVVRMLIDAYQIAVSLQTQCGMTPLYLATWSHASTDVLRLLLQAGPRCVLWPTQVGETPLSLLWSECKEEFERDPDGTEFQKMDLFLRSAHHGTIAETLPFNRQWRILHAAAAACTPPDMFQYMIRRFPGQIRMRDEYGRLPLTLAVSARVYVDHCHNDVSSNSSDEDDHASGSDFESFVSMDHDDFEVENEEDGNDHAQAEDDDDDHVSIDMSIVDTSRRTTCCPSVIEQLIAADPTAASIPDPNGRLPLMLAIACQKRWDRGIRSVFEAAPQALLTRDHGTFLYPFMFAAVGEVSTVDTVFELLRAGPDLVKRGIHDDDWAFYYEEEQRKEAKCQMMKCVSC
mmetsp:Transcript_10507/g.15774  ORF Transcript_10507/g.15774 Transcript_10507/m.15774 type:complete len:437 (-) Transcript_10507:144-1454(-)|eukprot:CAMPEP_0116034018 /NCGR_PEP_ID=MMETSP0321-20121206/19342_1 /TAXON_ID=163516 /ORGANISM="Leptocylindrus danicus var. danicus, Strain B650" /LENGTH=436 /DNA_ID=CAMNT_0003510219 /DNA_START=200 /DNA_END=1510 /DNA_ORIENTATION=-